MTNENFTRQVLLAEASLYRISKTILKSESDCEDAVQEAILKAFEKKNTLKEEAYFKTWLIRILMNECYSILRKKKNYLPYEEYLEQQVEMQIEDHSQMYHALQKLPAKIRITVVLFYVEEYSVLEIKSILGIPAGTVKSRLAKGRKLLRKELETEREVTYGTV